MSDDYGFYGKGYEGYSHYMQGMKEAERGSRGGGPRKSNNNDGKGCAIAVGVIIFLIYLIIKAIFE